MEHVQISVMMKVGATATVKKATLCTVDRALDFHKTTLSFILMQIDEFNYNYLRDNEVINIRIKIINYFYFIFMRQIYLIK